MLDLVPSVSLLLFLSFLFPSLLSPRLPSSSSPSSSLPSSPLLARVRACLPTHHQLVRVSFPERDMKKAAVESYHKATVEQYRTQMQVVLASMCFPPAHDVYAGGVW